MPRCRKRQGGLVKFGHWPEGQPGNRPAVAAGRFSAVGRCMTACEYDQRISGCFPAFPQPTARKRHPTVVPVGRGHLWPDGRRACSPAARAERMPPLRLAEARRDHRPAKNMTGRHRACSRCSNAPPIPAPPWRQLTPAALLWIDYCVKNAGPRWGPAMALPDLAKWFAFYGGYDQLSAWAWAEWDRLYVERQRMQKLSGRDASK